MFRIKKIFDNEIITIYKIEGYIKDSDLEVWSNEIRNFTMNSKQQIILEICDVTYISPKATENLIEMLSEKIYLLNCPTFVKNMLYTAGLSENVLD